MKVMTKDTMTKRFVSFVVKARKADRTTKVLWGSVSLAAVVMAFVVVMIATNPKVPYTEAHDNVDVVTLRHPLTGEAVDAVAPLPQVFAVMIENSADAWPLSGLEDAFLVIEAPVEGMIPRFEVFFADDATTEKIGPVRSARPYYLDWADELDAVYAHVGGSPEALDLIKEYGTIDLNEFFHGWDFYRSSQRYAPHNTYTTMEQLRTAIDELEPGTPEYEGWTFKDGAVSGEEKSLSIDWTSGTTYDMTWEYAGVDNRYVRNQGDGWMMTEDNWEIRADNVVVVATDIGVIAGDDKGRRTLRTIGMGDAMIFQDGRVIIGTWKKELRTDRLRFYDVDGKEIAMNAGKTWVEVVGSLGQVTVEASE